MWLFFVGCVPVNSSDPEVVPFHAETPQIEALSVECDSIDGEWIFRIQTTGWTGGGRLYMARDATTVEQHKIGSTEASASGQWDCLIEELDVSEDWTLAQSGSSTRWLCSDETSLSFLVQVDDARAEDVADCATWGADPSLWSEVDGVEDCEEILQPTGETTDTGSISWKGECDG